MAHHRTVWNLADEGVLGHWGVASSSIDWCEANYLHSFYIAELFNTISNIAFIALALLGIYKDVQQRLPRRFALAHAGASLIGVGSALFHATLSYEFQLLDELPMIYVTSLLTWIVFDLTPLNSSSAFSMGLPAALLAFDVGFTWAYLNFPNPVFHQVAFGLLVVATAGRGAWLLIYKLRDTPENRLMNEEARRLQLWGSASFLFAFALWNVDNLFCSHINEYKLQLGAPQAWLLEGHAWWHLFSGLAVYLILVSNSYLTLAVRDDPTHYQLAYFAGFLPTVERTPKCWLAVGEVPITKDSKVVD